MQTLTLFAAGHIIATGGIADVAQAAQTAQALGQTVTTLDDATGRVVDLDLRGTPAEVAARHTKPASRGRPKLGVTAKEVTLLPRHWDWLAQQKGGASATLRRLVEDARRAEQPSTGPARERTHRVMTALAGDLAGYGEALRALYAGDAAGFTAQTASWPKDLRSYLSRLCEGAWA